MREKGAAMYYSSGNYEAFARPKKPAGIDHKSAYIVGTGLAALSAAAYLHCRFENIHPFAAGNGATGRVLLNFFLLCRDHPPLVFFSQDKERYLQCLTRYDKTRDPRPFRDFLEEELFKTWER